MKGAKTDAFTTVITESESEHETDPDHLSLFWMFWKAVSLPSTGEQEATRYSSSAGRSTSVSVFKVWTHVSGISPRGDECADLATGQRISRHALFVGLELRSRVLSTPSHWRLLQQNACV